MSRFLSTVFLIKRRIESHDAARLDISRVTPIKGRRAQKVTLIYVNRSFNFGVRNLAACYRRFRSNTATASPLFAFSSPG